MNRLAIKSNLPDFGKVPPRSIDMEEAVLGSILIEPDSYFQIMHLLRSESFYKEAHQKLYSAIQNLARKNSPVDIYSVSEQLRATGELESVGGPVFISKITDTIGSTANIEYYARIIAQKFMQRELIRLSQEVQNRAFDDSIDVAELFEYAETELLRISGTVEKKEPVKLIKLVDTVINKIEKIVNKEIKFIGKPSGFTEIDRKTGGFKDGELTILAGRPSMGKTALALQIAYNAAEQNYPVGIFSLEMSGESLAQRYISGASGKTNVELMSGEVDLMDLVKQVQKFVSMPIYIDDTCGISMVELRAKARKLMLQSGIKLIIIDYLHLMETLVKNNREQEISALSRGLKQVAKDLNIPVIALSQLSRKCEERADKRPMLSDLRDSGSIEQDADTVWFIYRPAWYGMKSVIIDGREVESNGIAEIYIAKNRNGITGSFFLSHNTALTEFTDIIETQCAF